LFALASGNIHDLPREACCAIARLGGTAPGAPIGGGDPPQPASINAAAPAYGEAAKIQALHLPYSSPRERNAAPLGFGLARPSPRGAASLPMLAAAI
jgi:hypothetical protein